MRAFRIQYDKGVAKWVRQLTVDFANWFLENFGVDHQIKIRLFAAGYLDTGNESPAYATFFHRYGKPNIYVATWWYYWRDDGHVKDRQEAREEFLDSLAHEFCEYHKWRRGVPNNHRGIQRQIDSLVRRFEYDNPQ